MLFFLVLFAPVLLLQCKKDPDTTPQKVTLYLMLCPSGKNTCYGNCGVSNDTNGNGIVDPVELTAFESCTSYCDRYCDTSFLYFLL